MCKKNSRLLFCSCSDDKHNDAPPIEDHAWTLDRFIGKNVTSMRGKILGETPELSDEINLDSVLEELNSKNCFDFDYVPEERDCLRIYTTEKYRYFKVLFKDGKWQHGSNPHFSTISKSIFEGKIKRIDK